MQVDNLGNLIWFKTYGGPGIDYSNELIINSDNGYLLGGATESFGFGKSDLYLIKTDSNGVSNCNKQQDTVPTLGSYTVPQVNYTLQKKTGGASANITFTNTNTVFADSVICSTIITNIHQQESQIIKQIEIFPNPSNEFTKVVWNDIQDYDFISLINMTGEKVIEKNVYGKNSIQLNISSIAPGMYFIEFKNKSTKVYRKIIKE